MKIKMDISGIPQKGITIDIIDKGLHQGHLVINKKYLLWYKGKATKNACGKITWKKALKEKNNERKRGSRERNEWSRKEERLLKERYKTMSAKKIADKTGRTLASVRGKIARLGLRKR